MPLSLRNDPSRPSGGHAILEGPDLSGVASLTFENVYSGLFLSEGGRWGKRPHAFAVEAVPGASGALRLGPDVVDHVPSDLQLAVTSGDGRELGRVFWLDIVPSRSRPAPAPVIEPPPPRPAPAPAPPPPPVVAAPGPAEPPPALAEAVGAPAVQAKRSAARWRWPVAAILLVAAGGASVALLHRDRPTATSTPVSDARRCADGFGAKVAALRETDRDEDRVQLTEDALAARCGAQAFAALDGADWEANEPAAWHLARFYDPNETDPAIRAAVTPHPDWAAAYYVRWAGRVPRDAAALKLLCSTDGATLTENAQIARACGR